MGTINILIILAVAYVVLNQRFGKMLKTPLVEEEPLTKDEAQELQMVTTTPPKAKRLHKQARSSRVAPAVVPSKNTRTEATTHKRNLNKITTSKSELRKAVIISQVLKRKF